MPGRPRNPLIRLERIELLDRGDVLANFRDRSNRDLSVRLLAEEAQRLGGRFEDRPDKVLGYRQTFEAAAPIRPRPGELGGEVNNLELEIQIQEYPSDPAADQLAVGVSSVRGGDSSTSYSFLLQAPAGDFAAAQEFTVVRDRITPTNSWWTALTGCLTRQCVTVCANSIATCRGSWIEYLGCVAWNCGGCWVKCAACATCNCGWWCQWATGCCHQ